MTHTEKAAELHASGHNCAQAVAMAFADTVGMSEEELGRISEAFGLGGGGMDGVCGALAGAQMIIGLRYGSDAKDGSRAKCYQKSKELLDSFREKNGSITCRELKGVDTGKVLRVCRGCVTDAADILESILQED